VRASPWSGRSVFLTGHTGFKGSWLALRLAGAGARVHGYALAPDTTPSLYEAAKVGSALASSTIADLRDRERLDAALREADPEIVFHLAAQPLVRRSYREPLETWDVNVMGTVAVFEAARTCERLRGILAVTTDKVYAHRGAAHPFVEDDPLGGHDPYSASKAACELVAASYRDAFLRERGVAVATARAGNVIGGGDWAEERLMTDVVRAAYEGRPLAIRYPDAVRPWQHVLDAIDGYVRLGERMLTGEGNDVARAWNFGPDPRDVASVRAVVAEAGRAFGSAQTFDAASPEFVEAAVLTLDSAAAQSQVGWRSRLRLPEALAWTAEWYRTYYDGGDVVALTRQQIAAYAEIAA